VLLAALAACAPSASPPAPTPSVAALAIAESAYAGLRELRDRIDVATASGRSVATDGTPLGALRLRHDSLRERVAASLAAVDSAALRGDDARALGVMRRALAQDLGSVAASAPAECVIPAGCEGSADCAYDAGAIAAAPNGLDSLRARLYACYGWTQSHLVLGTDTLDRLSILGALGRTDGSGERRRLFLALEPAWRSVNGDGSPASPYRQLIALEVKARGTAEWPAAAQARGAGVGPA
jgi:hypothetical protein